jgi:hypothetical protein
VSLATALVTIAVYIPFMDTRWAIYIALCVGYTIAVFGLAWSDDKMPLFRSARAQSMGGVLQVHTVFLLLLVLWIWLARFSKPFLPEWVVAEGGQHGSWFLVFALLGIIAMLLFEHWWLAKKPNADNQNS